MLPRRPRPDLPADRHPVTIWQPDIEYGDGGAQRRESGPVRRMQRRPRRSPGCPARLPRERGRPGGRSLAVQDEHADRALFWVPPEVLLLTEPDT